MATKRQLDKEREALVAERDGLPLVCTRPDGTVDTGPDDQRAEHYTRLSDRIVEIDRELSVREDS